MRFFLTIIKKFPFSTILDCHPKRPLLLPKRVNSPPLIVICNGFYMI